MAHLLAFFGESGRHLEPKTRFLISVVTKVINFSERGLRQYIPRALREGASRDEVLDAILCAYPAAGLTKVVDAVQVLRSLDAPPAPDAAAGGAAWTRVARAADLAPGAAAVVEAGGRKIALYNVGGAFHATANDCLHQGGQLGCGALDGAVITCHRHGWAFDVTTGACLTQPGRQVASYPVQVVDGEVRILV